MAKFIKLTIWREDKWVEEYYNMDKVYSFHAGDIDPNDFGDIP